MFVLLPRFCADLRAWWHRVHRVPDPDLVAFMRALEQLDQTAQREAYDRARLDLAARLGARDHG